MLRRVSLRGLWLSVPALALAISACEGRIGDGTAPPTPPGEQPGDVSFALQPAELPRLTAEQYRNSIEDLLGPDLPVTVVQPDTNPYLFVSIGANTTELSELGVQQIEEAAELVSQHVFADAARRLELVGCEPASPGDNCVAEFVARFGRRVFRRPLTDVEQARWLAVSGDLSAGDPWEGVRMVVSGLLQSPHFIYRVELGEADPDDPSRLRYTGHEMATRLSYLLWNTTPDDELLDAADSGELVTTTGITAQAERLLADPRADAAVQEFFSQYFDLGRLEGLSRDPEHYPAFTASLPAAMRTEVTLIVDDLVNRRDADIREVFTTRRTFVNSDLATLYEVEAEGASPVAFVPVELPADGHRAGLLTLGAFLAMNAHETETSPTLRGKYLRERVLCQVVPPPPDDVNIDLTPKEGEEPKTLRERLEQHRDDPNCSSCHAFIDPPGFLFENFDSVGAYRTQDNGYPIDASGDIDGEPLQSASELAAILAEHENVSRCIVTQLYRHAQARLDHDDEENALADLDARFAAGGYRFRQLLVTLVTHDSFRHLSASADGQEEQP